MRQGETCDYSIRLNWEGRPKRKASERTPEREPHLSTVKLEKSPGPEVVRFQTNSAGSNPPTALGTTSETASQDLEREVDDVLAKANTNPLKTPHLIPLTLLTSDAQGGDNSCCPPTGSQEAMDPFNSGMVYHGSGSDRTDPSTQCPSIKVIHGAVHLQSYLDHHAEAGPHGGPSPSQAMLGSFGDSRPLKRPRSDPPSTLDISTTNSRHGHDASPCATEFAQAFQSSTAPARYSSIDSTVEFPHIHSMSSTMSGLANDTSAGCSLRSSAWSLPPIPETPGERRRLSVNALLSSPINTEFGSQPNVYGIDKGFPDLDIPQNNDNYALDGTTPLSNKGSFIDTHESSDGHPLAEFGFGLVLPSGGEYYASPVPVVLERNLDPLPAVLLDNQINLLYFHHFINHTARILVPHDCLENPFGTILPQSEPLSA